MDLSLLRCRVFWDEFLKHQQIYAQKLKLLYIQVHEISNQYKHQWNTVQGAVLTSARHGPVVVEVAVEAAHAGALDGALHGRLAVFRAAAARRRLRAPLVLPPRAPCKYKSMQEC